jgi:HlyD family secretion protein
MKQFAIIGLIIATLVALAMFRSGTQGEGLLVSIETVKTGELRSSVIASGSLMFRDEVQLRSEIIGKVIDVAVVEGAAVQKGQLLLQLDPELPQAELEQQQASVSLQNIAIAKQKQVIHNIGQRWTRQKALRKTGSIGEQTFEDIDHQWKLAKIDLESREHSLSQAQAALNKAQDLLEKTRITSPLTGIVTALDVKVGETVITGTTNIVGSSLMTIASPEDIIAEVYIDEADIANLALEQNADIFAVAYPDVAINGTVESISSTARQYPGRDGQKFKIEIRLNNVSDITLFSGMSCRAEIFREEAVDQITVPIEAIQFDEEEKSLKKQAYVFLEQEGKAKKVMVELGASSDERQAVNQGLDLGQNLITGPYRQLKKLEDGNTVRREEE